MKSRISTYILLVAAFAVWGIVAWKILYPRQTSPDTITPKVVEQETKRPDGYRLALDYEDPFLKGTEAHETPKPLESVRPSPTYTQSAPPQDVPPVKYAGTISTGGKTLFLFEHGGLLSSLSFGEVIEGYTLTCTSPDSVRLTKNGIVFTVNIDR